MSDKEYTLRSNCPRSCPCVCHDTGGSGHNHHGQRCRDYMEARDWRPDEYRLAI